MKKIFKYELPPCPGSIITINEKLIQPLSVQYQHGKPTLWAIIDDEDLEHPTDITSFGTGWELPDSACLYLGSLQHEEGYVWHYFTLNVCEMINEIDCRRALTVLANALGKMGVSMDEAVKSFDMEGLFDACM